VGGTYRNESCEAQFQSQLQFFFLHVAHQSPATKLAHPQLKPTAFPLRDTVRLFVGHDNRGSCDCATLLRFDSVSIIVLQFINRRKLRNRNRRRFSHAFAQQASLLARSVKSIRATPMLDLWRHTSPMASLAGYTHSKQKLNEIVKALRDCGTEEIIKLAKIAIIGNQSAGKSSLIEAISQIKVPRAAGTCTRCPMEVILSCADPEIWNCKVSLRIEHCDIPQQRLGTFPFAVTNVKDDVTNILRCAQLAILNPSKDFKSFANLKENECHEHRREMSFSKNTVVLEIIGADVDVTFIDLPGIISSTEKVISTILG